MSGVLLLNNVYLSRFVFSIYYIKKKEVHVMMNVWLPALVAADSFVPLFQTLCNDIPTGSFTIILVSVTFM